MDSTCDSLGLWLGGPPAGHCASDWFSSVRACLTWSRRALRRPGESLLGNFSRGCLNSGRTGLPREEEGSLREAGHSCLLVVAESSWLSWCVSGRDRTAGWLAELEWEPSLLLSRDLLPPLSWATPAGWRGPGRLGAPPPSPTPGKSCCRSSHTSIWFQSMTH